MLPPLLEIYVVWHPGDNQGEDVAEQIVEHFHGTAFSGLIGGAVEVYLRSAGWRDVADAPRPLPFAEPFPNGLAGPVLIAAVPVLGNQLAIALEARAGAWHDYVASIVAARTQAPDRVAVLPIIADSGALTGTRLGELLGSIQAIGVPSSVIAEPAAGRRCRDLAQALAQFAAKPSGQRIQVFVSHSKHSAPGDADRIGALIERIRYLIANTRLAEYFDESDLQPGTDWADELANNASRSALLAVRTDLYASREWCQREVRVAKTAGMPVVVLDALAVGEERGSFLMDHVARVAGGSERGDVPILGSLNRLVDECLKRALWARQHQLADEQGQLDFEWWAPHAPEPVTLASWLLGSPSLPAEGPVRVLHPDPPLGRDEADVLDQIAQLAGLGGRLEIMTPRGLSARGG
jgi:hypothetical protein